jgi:hypothetical protein
MSEKATIERCPDCELTLSEGICLMCGYRNPVPALEAKVEEQAGEINQLTLERDQLLKGNAWPLLQRLAHQAEKIKRLTEIATSHPYFPTSCVHDEEPWYCDSCMKFYQDEMRDWESRRDAALNEQAHT